MRNFKKIFELTVAGVLCCEALLAADQGYSTVAYEDPCCSTDAFFVQADFLYWTPRVTGLDWGFGRTEIDESVSNCTQKFSTEEVDCDPKFKWSPGFRLGAGWDSDRCGVEAIWTHFDGNAGKHSRSSDKIYNNGKLRIQFDQIDLAFSLYSNPMYCLTFEPFLGLRAVHLHDKIKIKSSIEMHLESDLVAWEQRINNDKQDYWGAGPLLGVQVNWNVGCGVDLFGLISGSLLYGRYDVHWKDQDIFTGAITEEVSSLNKKHVRGFDFNLDLAVGINWNVWSCGTRALDMSLGFEHHQFWNQNHLCSGRGDISFTGGFYSIAFKF